MHQADYPALKELVYVLSKMPLNYPGQRFLQVLGYHRDIILRLLRHVLELGPRHIHDK